MNNNDIPALLDRAFLPAWRLAKAWPRLALTLFIALQTLFTLGSRDLWFSDEVRYANAFQNLVQAKKWVVLYLNGQFYPDKPPLYFWLLAGLKGLWGAIDPALFMLGAAVSAFLLLQATLFLARSLRQDDTVSLLAPLLLLTNFYFIGLAHYSRMDLLFAALITLSLGCLFRAWRDEGDAWAPAGFALAGLATITKGPLGLIFPLLTSVLFLARQRRLRRLLRRDALLGLGIMAAIPLAWLLAALLVEGRPYLDNIFYKQIYKRAVDTWHHPQPFWHYFLVLPLVWLPWTLLLPVLPWRAIRDRLRCVSVLRATPGDEAPSFLWLWAAGGLLFLSLLSIKIAVYLLPLFPPLAVLTARGMTALSGTAKSRLFGLVGGLILALGVGLAVAEPFLPLPVTLKGAALCTLILLGLGHVLFHGRFAARQALMIALLLGLTVFIQPAALLVAPSLDPVMSPKPQALALASYADRGYFPASFGVYSGTYTYYAGRDILETNDRAEIDRVLAEHDKVVLAMRKKDWEAWPGPAGLKKVHEQIIVDRPFVLVVKE